MLNNDIYAIFTEDDERKGSIKELYYSFEEAKADRYKYANWFCSKGDIWIRLYKAENAFKCSYSWHILPDGSITSVYNF